MLNQPQQLLKLPIPYILKETYSEENHFGDVMSEEGAAVAQAAEPPIESSFL